MRIEEIRIEIAKHETIVEELEKEFEQKRQEIIALIKVFAKDKINQLVDETVRNNSEHTKTLGSERLKGMKIKLHTILDECDATVDTVFLNDEVWMHIGYEETLRKRNTNDYTNAKDAEKNIISGICLVLGKAGELLRNFGYIEVIPRYSYNTFGPWKEISKDKITYGYGLSLPKELEIQIEVYRKGIYRLHSDINKLGELNIKLSQQEASDLWNQL